MELDETIVQLGAKLDEWSDGFLARLNSDDRAAQGKTLLAGIEILKELDSLKAKGLATIKTLLERPDAKTDNERVASLLRGFEFAAKLSATLRDELMDTDGVNQVVVLMDEMASTLDAIGPGRVALAELLDHSDVRVRASAGAYLLIVNLMPDRVVPLLREIDEQEHGNSAHFTAHWAVLEWDLKEKARTKS